MLMPSWATQIVPVSAVQSVYSGLNYPVSFKFAPTPDGRLFFNEKNTGKIRLIASGVLQTTPFATLTVATDGGEQGLLGIALDPNFASNNFLYVYYTYSDGTFYHGRITRFTATGNIGTSPVDIFDVTDPTPQTTNHNGGYLKFGPDDKLYVQVGEFATPSLSQNLTSNAGKILRMNPNGSIPSDNPFSGSLIYAYGIRNGFGMDFDPFTGKLIATEAGPDKNDEINFIVVGGNYCWPTFTGVTNNPTCKDPILTFTPTVTPTGIAYGAKNMLYFGEYNTGNLKLLRLKPDGTVGSVGVVATVVSAFDGILSVELGSGGEVYFSTSTTIYKIAKAATVPINSVGTDIVDAPTNSVIYVLPDGASTHPKPSGVGYALLSDWTALGYMYGVSSSTQVIALDTNSTYFDTTTGAPKVSNSVLVLFAGPLVNAVVHYYERVGLSQVCWQGSTTTHSWFNRNGTLLASLSGTTVGTGTSDMFLLEYFADINANKVFIIYGFGYRGTYAGGLFFKNSVLPNIGIFTQGWYIFQWNDANGNGLPESYEINPSPVSTGN